MANSIVKNMLTGGGFLALFALVSSTIVAFTAQQTDPTIIENERQALLKTLNVMIAHERYNNDIISDTIEAYSPKLLGSKKPITIYRARMDRRPIAAIISTQAPDGYNGTIKLLVAINYNNTIAGVRVVAHKETPGLGDAIEARRSDWIEAFAQRSLKNPQPSVWKVKKDGGQFDQLTGATITPRAIVNAVYNTLTYFTVHRDELFKATTNTLLSEDKHEPITAGL